MFGGQIFFLKEEIPAWLRAKDLDSSLSLQFFMAGHVPTMFVRHLTFLLVQDVFSVALLNTGALSHFIGNMIQVYIISIYMRPTGWSFGHPFIWALFWVTAMLDRGPFAKNRGPFTIMKMLDNNRGEPQKPGHMNKDILLVFFTFLFFEKF